MPQSLAYLSFTPDWPEKSCPSPGTVTITAGAITFTLDERKREQVMEFLNNTMNDEFTSSQCLELGGEIVTRKELTTYPFVSDERYAAQRTTERQAWHTLEAGTRISHGGLSGEIVAFSTSRVMAQDDLGEWYFCRMNDIIGQPDERREWKIERRFMVLS